MRFIKVNKRSTFNMYDPIGVILVKRLPLDLHQLNEFKFRHSFSDIVSPICDCGSEIESTEHFLLESNHLFKSLPNIKPPILNLEKNTLTNVLLFRLDNYEQNYKCKQIKVNNPLS